MAEPLADVLAAGGPPGLDEARARFMFLKGVFERQPGREKDSEWMDNYHKLGSQYSRLSREAALERHSQLQEKSGNRTPHGSRGVVHWNRRAVSGENWTGPIKSAHRGKFGGQWPSAWDSLHPDTPASEIKRIKDARDSGKDPFPDFLQPDEEGVPRPFTDHLYPGPGQGFRQVRGPQENEGAFNQYMNSLNPQVYG